MPQEVSSALAAPLWRLRDDHVDVWRQLFRSGLSISPSKAVGAINGDRINATLYLTLSQVSQCVRSSTDDSFFFTPSCSRYAREA